jgi:hypothetical protein
LEHERAGFVGAALALGEGDGGGFVGAVFEGGDGGWEGCVGEWRGFPLSEERQGCGSGGEKVAAGGHGSV